MYTQFISPNQESTVRLQLNLQPHMDESAIRNNSDNPLSNLVKQALESSFLLIGHPGPSSFVLVAKNGPKQMAHKNGSHKRTRFHVVIGPQLCSCRSNPTEATTSEWQRGGGRLPCIHILFIMIRVLKIPSNDPCLPKIPLPASKVESLIHSYQSTQSELLTYSTCDPRLTNMPSSPSSCEKPLAIPEAIRPYQRLGSPKANKSAQLFSSVGNSHQNSPECCELSKLTRNIKPVSRPELDINAPARPSTTSSNVVTSPASSFDSMASSGPRPPDSKDAEECSDKAVTQRPRTAPQPEPPPRLGYGARRSIRHACSTMFRPIRDQSPNESNRLSPTISEETGTYNCGISQSAIAVEKRSTLSAPDTEGNVSAASPQAAVNEICTFRHEKHSPFKAVGPKVARERHDDGTRSTRPSSSTTSGNQFSCALCLQHVDPSLGADRSIKCLAQDQNRCRATFHLSCCRIWLQEATADGDYPHCPFCMNRWDPLPIALQRMSPDIPSEVQPAQLGTPCCTCQAHPTQNVTTGSQVDSENGTLNKQLSAQSQVNPPEAVNTGTTVPAAGSTVQPKPNQTPYPEYQNCVAAFSLEIADGIASRQSARRRQTALQQAAQLTVSRILLARQQYQFWEANGTVRSKDDYKPTPLTNQSAAQLDCLRVMLRLIQYLFDDPVDAVYIDALRAFREILGYLVCFNVETQTALQRAIGPIIRRLLRFVGGASVLWTLRDLTAPGLPVPQSENEAGAATCLGQTSFQESRHLPCGTEVDGIMAPEANLRDRANLALATLVELAKGQAGALAIGRDVGYHNQCLAVCGLQHMARFVLSSAKFHATHLIGRLTLLDKLIRMDQSMTSRQTHCIHGSMVRRKETALGTQTTIKSTDHLARRHLCSSLVFARRHLLPPVMNTQMPVCFPRHYQLQGANLWTQPEPTKSTGGVPDSTLDSLYNTQLKASRVARRVFLSAARALLTYGNTFDPECSPVLASNQAAVNPHHDFCPREFVELEIDRTEAPLAAWLRNKLSHLLYPNLCLTTELNPIPHRMAVSEAPMIKPMQRDPARELNSQKLSNSHSVDDMPNSYLDHQVRTHSLSPTVHVHEEELKPTTKQPPTPPPRRNQRFNTITRSEEGANGDPSSYHSQFLRVALEPAYDLVALSESGHYSSASEYEEDGDKDDSVSLNEPTYGGRSLGSEAELQTEQTAVLRSALRQCSQSCQPLLPVPALSIVMDAFRSTHNLPNSDEYYESIDWIRGPILGHGAFSQCYQARDRRTGLLMAVKRIRLGDGIVFSVASGHVSNGANEQKDEFAKHKHHNVGKKGAKCTTQLAEVQAEVDIMLRLNHPNVLRIFGAVYSPHHGVVDLFVEWMPGGSITSLLQQYGAFNESVTLSYGVQVVRGVAYLHKHGILHRDLKGANLLVDNTGSLVRISDFGASASLSGNISVAGQFQGQVIGTFSFMAPEVLRGETYGRACDIWSVGCCLIEMLTGKPPWHDARLTNRYALMFTIATSDTPPTYPPNLNSDLLSVLNACFARHAQDRPTASKLLNFRAFARLTESASHLSEDDVKQGPGKMGTTSVSC